MRRSITFLIPGLAASLLLAACGGSSHSASAGSAAVRPPAAAQSSGATTGLVKTASNPTLGTVLVTAQGMTLYRLSVERNGRFICANSACLQLWHPLKAPASGPPTGSVGSLGTIKRPDGTRQVTYKGLPLYTFAQDQKPGQARGQGFRDVGTWNAATTGGKAPQPVAAPSGGSYGY